MNNYITSIHNSLVKHLVKLRENSRYREEQGVVLISGFKLIREIAAKTPPKKIFTENPSDIEIPCPEIYPVTHTVLKKITGLPSPEPIAALFPLPPPSNLKNKTPLLVLDAIRDPGNLGTLVRTALALGWGGVFFLPSCVDPFNEKVIRASRAALFRLPWRAGIWEELLKLKEENQLNVYIADVEGQPLPSLKRAKNILLLLSNEAKGVRDQTEEFGKKITIPMEGEMESLNVAIAGAILMYNMNE